MQVRRMSPHQFVMCMRLEKARDLSTRAKLSISEIAVTHGFKSQSHFTRDLWDLIGRPPRVWRTG